MVPKQSANGSPTRCFVLGSVSYKLSQRPHALGMLFFSQSSVHSASR